MNEYRTHELVCSDVLDEVVEEIAIELLTEDLLQSDVSSTKSIERDKELEETMVKHFSRSILIEVLSEEIKKISKDHFDLIVKKHFKNMEAVRMLNLFLNEVIPAMIEEIIVEILDHKTSKQLRNEILEPIIAEVVAEEATDISCNVLDHYGSRVALSQYKQMQDSAANMILDFSMLHSLLMQYQQEKPTNSHSALEVTEGNAILDKIMLEILLAQSLALHECFPNKNNKHGTSNFAVPLASECIPIKWYKKKIAAAIAEDVVVSLLCERLDESMQMLEEKHMESQVVSLFHHYLDNSGRD